MTASELLIEAVRRRDHAAVIGMLEEAQKCRGDAAALADGNYSAAMTSAVIQGDVGMAMLLHEAGVRIVSPSIPYLSIAATNEPMLRFLISTGPRHKYFSNYMLLHATSNDLLPFARILIREGLPGEIDVNRDNSYALRRVVFNR